MKIKTKYMAKFADPNMEALAEILVKGLRVDNVLYLSKLDLSDFAEARIHTESSGNFTVETRSSGITSWSAATDRTDSWVSFYASENSAKRRLLTMFIHKIRNKKRKLYYKTHERD